MNYWLIKSEPAVYSFDNLLVDRSTFWDGVRNYAARNYLKQMKKGDQAFFYHSNEGLAIEGIVTISREAYQDPTTEDKNWVVVDVKPFRRLVKPVTLEMVKKEKSLAEMELVRNSRLSVQKVGEKEWNRILAMSEK